jgi:hypothetical protein
VKRNELLLHAERLKAEAESSGDMDEATKARISELIDQIEHQIANPDDHVHREGLVDKLRGAVEHFEAEHPSLTDTLNRIMVALGI